MNHETRPPLGAKRAGRWGRCRQPRSKVAASVVGCKSVNWLRCIPGMHLGVRRRKMDSLLGVLSAFGLSASAGLNAYIPLLVVALMAKLTPWIKLSAPWDTLTSWWVIGILGVLLLIE